MTQREKIIRLLKQIFLFLALVFGLTGSALIVGGYVFKVPSGYELGFLFITFGLGFYIARYPGK